ncbi:MAG TPA: YggS family pyridoxal phosphate-dependent enzyme [Steroidobacteraceae bacterium]|nr:YggS family pyridoxal phosphate-dependent enzyme [Steroidobacteraceae bacterium]
MLTVPQFLPDRLAAVTARIAAAAGRAGRDPAEVRLLAVSKQQPAEMVRAAAAAGQREFGENYVQEAIPKIDSLRDLPLTWHFIGQLQANKTRDVAAACQWVHTVDRPRIAERLSAQRPHYAGPLDVLLQVKVSGKAGKGGVAPESVADLAAVVTGLPRLRLRGLMCMPEPAAGEMAQREPFRRLRELHDDLRRQGHALDTLSMGMSDDLEAAVLEGATIVRVGTAVFGPRN